MTASPDSASASLRLRVTQYQGGSSVRRRQRTAEHLAAPRRRFYKATCANVRAVVQATADAEADVGPDEISFLRSKQSRSVQLDSARHAYVDCRQGAPISCSQLAQIKPPVAIARGERGRPFFRVIAESATRCMPTSTLIVVPNAKHHWPGKDDPGFNATRVDFPEGKTTVCDAECSARGVFSEIRGVSERQDVMASTGPSAIQSRRRAPD